MRNIFRPVDLLSLYFIAGLTALTVTFIPSIPHWGWLIARLGMLLVAIFAFSFYEKKRNVWKPVSLLHDFLPVFVILVLFDTLGDIIPSLWPAYFDDLLTKIDHRMFGVHPTVWLERFIHPALTTLLQFAYISYYPMAIVLGIVLLTKGKRGEFHEAIFGLVLCFYLSYFGYIIFPAIGPRFTLAHLQTRGLEAGPLTAAIQETLNRLENTKTDAFPSGHTAVALMTLYYAWKSKEKVLSALLLPVVLALIVSTVYLRYHYVIDVIAGIALAAFTISLAPKALRWMAGSPEPPRE